MRNALIVLNWNGGQDTIEMLDSVKEQIDSSQTLFIFDNGSTDNSVDKIRDWLIENVKFVEVKLDFFCSEQMLSLLPHNRYVLIQSDENYGFAKPNNMVIRQALKAGFQYITMCNNDTILSPNTLSGMLSFMDTHTQFGCCSCNIRYYDRQDTIWHAGGYFTFYGDLLIYSNKKVNALKKKYGNTLTVTVISGCYFMCRCSILQEHGLLSEEFFFGGEDINYCARMKKAKIPLGINLAATIYHKVNASFCKDVVNPNYKHIIHFTNRLIDISHSMSRYKFAFFKIYYLCLLFIYFSYRYKNLRRAFTIVNAVKYYTGKNDSVPKEIFDEICQKYS